jgi:integrase
MHSLRAAVSETDILLSTRALSAIERDDETSPSGRQLCTLAKKLLTGTAYPDASWSHASIRCCILTVARRFAIQRKNEDPSTYSATTWVELCKLSIDEAAEDSASPQGLQKTVRWALLQYHRHLVDDCEAVPFDERAVLRVLPGSDPADAHVLTIDEIFQVIEHIQFSRNRKWKELHRIVAVGQAVLDFLGGLRRAEGLGLLPTDLLPGSFCEVKVSDNDIRALKTDNAYRRVRLGPMAHPFPELLDPVHVLFQEAKRLGTDLSCGLSDDTIVPIIHEALQAVTGSDDCHLHTFRHSAAHWMYMRLMIADLDQAAAKLFPHWPKTTIWLQASRDLRCLLLHNNDSVNDTGWAVCATLGHSNPDTVTLRYYVHCLDLLLAFFLEARTKLGAPATREAIRGLSGLPLSTAYSQLPASTDNVNRNVSVDGLQEADGARPMTEGEFALQIFSYRLGLSIPSSCHALSPPVDSPFWPKDTYDILWMSMELGLTSERLATIFGLNEQCIGAILSRADSVLRTHGFQRSPNRVLGNQKVRDEAQTRTVKVPKPPRIGFDSDAFREWSAKIGDHVGGNQKGMAALSHMATNMVPATAQVVFARVQQPELMQACLRVFEALGFGCNDLHAVSCDETEQANPSRKWLRERGISWRITATNQFGRSRLLKVPPPWVVVGPKPPLDATARLEAEAVWFLVRMGAIWFSL